MRRHAVQVVTPCTWCLIFHGTSDEPLIQRRLAYCASGKDLTFGAEIIKYNFIINEKKMLLNASRVAKYALSAQHNASGEVST